MTLWQNKLHCETNKELKNALNRFKTPASNYLMSASSFACSALWQQNSHGGQQRHSLADRDIGRLSYFAYSDFYSISMGIHVDVKQQLSNIVGV